VHGYWTANGRKISKSLGNAVDPLEEIQKYGLDVYRYFNAREMSFGSDGDYSARALVGRNNAELADDLGNLLSRVTAMIARYFEGKMPAAENPTAADQALVAELDRLRDELPGHLERCTIHAFLERINQTVVLTNRYLTEQAPWTRAKEGNMARVGTILAVASRMLAGVARSLYPVMPGKMTDLLAAYGLPKPERLENAAAPAEIKIEPAKPLFPQLEVPEPAAQAAEAVGAAPGAPEKRGETAPAAKEGAAVKKNAASGDAAAQPAPLKPEITIDDFVKVDLRIATVLEAEPVPRTDKLMRLTIDIGVEKRQIVAGIAEHYKAQDLVGRQIVVVANLAPRKLKGLESKGMLLAAKIGGELFLLRPDGHLAPGADVS
jgi:methionyl-tRNA synthetase